MHNGLTHFDQSGAATMVDVTDKEPTSRVAVAKGSIRMNPQAYEAIRTGTAQKGDVLGVARLAGIMAAKRTHELIPLCHPLMLTKVAVDFTLCPESLSVRAACAVRLVGKTGAEMEAMTGVTVALLTVYDMCKALDREMELTGVSLEEKDGGKSGHYTRGGVK